MKYDTIGTDYNATRQADPYLTERLLHHLQPNKNGRYLDIGCGTGNYTLALAGKGFKFMGLEPSERMLNEARSRDQRINWQKGSAEHIPANDGAFDGIIATLTIHHWTDLRKVCTEIDRVLADRGRFVLFTSTPEQMEGYWLNHYFPQMLCASIVQMPSMADIQEAIAGTRFDIADVEKYAIKDDLKDCFLYVGKHDPERYFDKTVRQGISSFSSLAHKEEVAHGLSALRSDLENGSFEAIRKKYENDLGDYLFITMVKNGGA